MTCVAIVSKPRKQELAQLLPELIAWLRQHNYKPLLDCEGAGYTDAAPAVDRSDMPAHKPQLVIVLGGDGTLLSVARIFAATGTPILSVNLGSLGFLTEVRLADLYTTLESWCDNCHTLDARTMLHAEVVRDGSPVKVFEALNEVVVSKGDIARMGEFAVELDGKKVARFRADGVIVSTPPAQRPTHWLPTAPSSRRMSMHWWSRPSVPTCLLCVPSWCAEMPASPFASRASQPNVCSLLMADGFELHLGDEVRCHRSDYTVNLVRLSESGFFDALRNKLSWGER